MRVVVLAATLLVGACASTGTTAPAGQAAPSSSPSAGLVATPTPSAGGSPSTSPSPSADGSLPAASRAGHLPGEPDPSLTPGATNPAVTQDTIGSTICVSGWTATVRPPSSYTTDLKRQQIAQYGYGDTNLADYEEDHLIPLELGGAPSDPRNLWPEPYTVSLPDGTPDGARVKDQLENTLKAMVCAGELPLATAQREIATDWVRAWLALGGSGGASLPPVTAAPPAAVAPASAAPPAASSQAGAPALAITSLTSPITAGTKATLVARTSPGASCTITVVYKSGPSSAAGLGPATAGANGDVSWTWTVGSRTTPGSWPVTVSCMADGLTASATATLVVQ